MIKPGYRTSEFWFTLVSFLFSGAFLLGVINDNSQKEDLINETTKGLEALILIIGQLAVLFRYIKGRNEIKKTVSNNNSIEQAKPQSSFKEVQRFALGEAWKLLQLTTASVVQIIEAIGSDLSNPDKKALAMNLLTSFYDKVFVVVDIPFVPSIIEPIIHKYIKNILMIMVSSTIDATVTIFRNTGVFIKKEAGL